MEDIQLLTRRGATCSELLSCLYNLKNIDLDVLFEVAKREQSTLDDIAKLVRRDRSTVHRTLSKLVSLGLIYKGVRALPNGGYFHVYSIVEITKMKDQANSRVKEITQSLEKLVDNFVTDFHKHLRQN